MKEKLKAYMEGEANYTPILNIMLNNRTKDWYDELGKYIVATLDIEKIPHLAFYADKLKPQGVVDKVKKTIFKDRTYSSIGIFFLTGALDDKALKTIFGKPLLHQEFGEGFGRRSKFDYASYFVTVDGMNIHIGYDHRGTGIEVDVPFDLYTGEVPDRAAEDTLRILKKLVDLYKDKVV